MRVYAVVIVTGKVAAANRALYVAVLIWLLRRLFHNLKMKTKIRVTQNISKKEEIGRDAKQYRVGVRVRVRVRDGIGEDIVAIGEKAPPFAD